MSRNYELLQKADKLDLLLPTGADRIADRSNGDYPQSAPGIRPNEEASKLVQRVFPCPGTPGPRTVVFADVGEAQGSARVCAMAAEALAARAVGTVCVVDSNFRSPSLHEWFNLDNFDGRADRLMHSGPIRDVARRIGASNLWLLPCGSRGASPANGASMDQLALRLKELREEFDYVLIHAAGADKYSDATVLGRLTDGVILVVEANSTPRETVQKAKQVLDRAEVRLLGAVLNNRRFPIPQAIYGKLK